MMGERSFHREVPPSLLISLVIYVLSVGLMGYLRLYIFHDRFVALTYGLPMLLCLWHQDRRLLWLLAATFSAMASYKAFVLLPDPNPHDLLEEAQWVMQLVNIFTITAVVHLVINLTRHLRGLNAHLEHANADLSVSNQEIARQNVELQKQAEELQVQTEELQSQSEELENQNEELRQQSEELEQQQEELQSQTEDIRSLNEELSQREAILKMLLDSMTSADGELAVIQRLCKSLVALHGYRAAGAAVVKRSGEDLVLYGYAGFEADEMRSWPFEQSFAKLVMEHGRPAFIDDLAYRPDITIPRSLGRPFQSILATPLCIAGEPIGALEVYALEPQQWTNQEMAITEWVAAQCSQMLQILHLHENLYQSERRVRAKLESILSPQGDVGDLELADILDTQAIQELLDEFYRVAHIPVSILDLKGKMLVGVGWQDVCTNYHRKHPATCRNCRESDDELSHGVPEGEYRLCRCKNNLWDIATPIVVSGKHVGNLFSGQFFFDDEQVDLSQFRAQARQYGFDEDGYMTALEAVPRLPRESVNAGMAFFIKLAQMVSQLSHSNLKLARSLAERETLMAILEETKTEAERANQAKDHFLAVLSHELRTPLTPVVTAAEMLKGEALAPGQRELVQMILRNVELEARLIDDLLDLTRVARGKVELHIEPVNMHEKIGHVIDMCQQDIAAGKLSVTLRLAAEDWWVLADPARLQQILWNLVKNAVKFTPPGGSIEIRTESSDTQVSVHVKDTGIGITPEFLPRIFDAFEQDRQRASRQFGGLGLGLAISKGLVALQGGTLEASSDGADKGSQFTLVLPAIAGEFRSETSSSISPGFDEVPTRILLVEDHPDTAAVISRLLSRNSYQVDVAVNVESALGHLSGNEYDLLISDIGLPDGTGIDLMRQISSRKPVKAIALSGYGMEEDVEQSLKAGFAVHITKPVKPEQLLQRVRELTAGPNAQSAQNPSVTL